ncbi:MAG: hypothetical protein ACK5P7_08685 [Bdellovibrio sp.]|jgi:hypothetical protein
MAKTSLRSSCWLAFGLSLGVMFSTSCAKKPNDDVLGDVSTSVFASGDLVVSNAGSRTLLLFDTNGKFKRVLASLSNTAGEIYTGVVLNKTTGQLIVAVDGVSDRLLAISTSGAESSYFIDAQLTGTIRGLTQLVSGDILISETNNVERVSSAGTPVLRSPLYGGQAWPKALQTTATGIDAMANGGFVHCSTGSDFLRTHIDNPVGIAHVATVASGIAGTTDVMDCRSDSANNVYAVFSGTTDTVRKYPTNLASPTWSFSDLGILSTPSGMAVRADGRVLVLDTGFNHVVEISANGSTGAVMQGGLVDIDDLLNNPQFIYVIP